MEKKIGFYQIMTTGLLVLFSVGILAHLRSLFDAPELLRVGASLADKEAYLGPEVGKWWMLALWILPAISVWEFWKTTKKIESDIDERKPFRLFFRHGAIYGILSTFISGMYDILFIGERTVNEYLSIAFLNGIFYSLACGIAFQLVDFVRLSAQSSRKPGP